MPKLCEEEEAEEEEEDDDKKECARSLHLQYVAFLQQEVLARLFRPHVLFTLLQYIRTLLFSCTYGEKEESDGRPRQPS